MIHAGLCLGYVRLTIVVVRKSDDSLFLTWVSCMAVHVSEYRPPLAEYQDILVCQANATIHASTNIS